MCLLSDIVSATSVFDTTISKYYHLQLEQKDMHTNQLKAFYILKKKAKTNVRKSQVTCTSILKGQILSKAQRCKAIALVMQKKK